MLLPLITVVALAQDSAQAYDGRARALAVRIPRADTTITVDGVLDEAVWSRAARLTGFSQYQPVDSRPAEEPTEVLVWYGPTAIYFGIRAREVHGEVVRATRADRDNIGADDNVQILLDTYHDHRRAFLFGVNPYGVQQDGIRSEGFAQAGGAFQGGGGFGGAINILDGNVDLNPDFVFESRGRLVPGGYEVEVRIPFKSLRYQGGNEQTWGINVLRRVQHSGYQDSWAPVVRASASFLIQSGTLEGLHDLRRGLVLELTPFATGRATGAPGASGYDYADSAQFGLNVHWGLSQNLGLDGTWNPDFSQVEADVGQVTLNERFALFFPEKRPFFLEGLELFAVPNQLIYTRRIVSPDVGVKLAGKVGATNAALLLAADDTSQSATSSHPWFAVTRLRRDLGRNSTVGLVGTLREDGADYSRIAGADIRVIHSRLYFVEFQAVRSWTRAAGAGAQGTLYQATWDRTGRGWGFNYGLTAISPDFRAAAGFVNRTGIVQTHAFNRLTWYGRRGGLLETATSFFQIFRIYDYASFGSRGALEGSEGIQPSATLRGGWNVAGGFGRSFFRFQPTAYAADSVVAPLAGGGSDTVAFTVPGKLSNLFNASGRITTPVFRQFSGTVSAGTAAGVIFQEAVESRETRAGAQLDWRPMRQARVSVQYTRLVIERASDGSRFSTEDIPRLKFEYQASRAIFVRFVGQYTARRRAALLDGQGRQIFASGAVVDATASNDFRTDWLFSYRPGPGTLIYLGYGASLSEPDAFAFGRDLARTSDGFFAKVSYLFRL